MPLGWYLAQGLYSLAPSESDDEEGPCTLPNGKVVCGPHGLVICGRCCSDYSFMEGSDEEEEVEDQDNEDDNDSSHDSIESPPKSMSRVRKGTGRVFPTKFVPPSDSVRPMELFTGLKAYMNISRHTLRNDPGTGLIHTDGACLSNGQPNPKAGWAFSHGIDPSGRLLITSARLEKKGPFGDDAQQTSNRAELRAVIAALQFRFWPGEGFHTLVFASDSEYVVESASTWARNWIRDGWQKRVLRASGGHRWENVKNRDLWEALLGAIERFKDEGNMEVKFWRIPREWNTVVDAAAKTAAAENEAPEQWTEIMGINL